MNKMKRHIIALLLFACPLLTMGQKITGTWSGELTIGPQRLRVNFNLSQNERGTDVCTLDSPDQNAMGIEAVADLVSADSLHISIPIIGASYAGKLQDGVIRGRFMQSGYTLPLDLCPGSYESKRSQTPSSKLSYRIEEVSFTNPEGTAVLSGTLSYPSEWGKGRRRPVALMVTGSGLQDRDEAIFGHRPFAVIADALAKHGIATLRYDDRGFGKSTGDGKNATIYDFAKDAAAGVQYLRGLGKFGKVGVIGHSEGAAIALMLASEGKIDFAIALASPGVQGDSISTEQNNRLLTRAGSSVRMTVRSLREKLKSAPTNLWLKSFLDFNPQPYIEKVKCPAMILNGEKDVQVIAATNLSTIERLLPPNKQNFIKVYPGLNHLFQHCQTGFPDEYSHIEETFSPEVLTDMEKWINCLR